MKISPKANQAVIAVESNHAVIGFKKLEVAAFFCVLFNSRFGETVKINKNEFAGRFIFSLRKYSETPVTQSIPNNWIPVNIELSRSEFGHPERFFNYYSIEHIEQINDFMQAYYDLYFHLYFFSKTDIDTFNCAEYGGKEATRMMLVDSFVFGLGIIDFDCAPETMKKREYRMELDIIKQKRKTFLMKDYLFRKKIFEDKVKNLKNIKNQ